MATLSELQTRAKKLSDIVSRKVVDKAPKRAVKGGTLKRALRKANTFDTMIDLQKGTTNTSPVKAIELSIDFAPADAPYGRYWNDPVSWQVKNRKTKNNPDSENFVDKALSESSVQKTLDELSDIIGEMVAASIGKEVQDLDK